MDQFQTRVQSLEAARKLVVKVIREVRDGAEAILSFGPYTHQNLLRGLETRIRYGPQIVEGSVGIDGRRYPYAASVEGGALPHTYGPRSPESSARLVFFWRKVGHVVYLTKVNHPGQTGKAYLRIPLLVVCPRNGMRVIIYDH